MKIPKIIHYCWFGRSEKPLLVKRCIETWKHLLPNYEIREWNEDNVEFNTPFLTHNLKKKNWAFLSDYIRMRVVHDFGGIYLDTDMEVVNTLDSLLVNKCFLGEEAKGRATTGIFGAEKGHNFLVNCMKTIDDRFLANKPYLIAPEVASLALKACKEDITVFGPQAFYPYNPYDTERGLDQLMYCDVSEETYAIHHWAKSWNMSFVEKVLRFISKSVKS